MRRPRIPSCSCRAGALAAALGLVAGCGAAPPADFLNSAPEPTVARGKVLFNSHGCVNCHGPEGYGNGHLAPTLDPPPRDFRDRTAYLQGTTAEAIAETLSTGILTRRTAMPPYAHLPRNDRLSIGLFIGSLQRQPHDSSDEP